MLLRMKAGRVHAQSDDPAQRCTGVVVVPVSAPLVDRKKYLSSWSTRDEYIVEINRRQ